MPDTSRPWDAAREPVWRRLVPSREPGLPGTWTAVVDLDALRGKPVSEAARWEEDDRELFSGPGPDFGEALWRDPPGPWVAWG